MVNFQDELNNNDRQKLSLEQANHPKTNLTETECKALVNKILAIRKNYEERCPNIEIDELEITNKLEVIFQKYWEFYHIEKKTPSIRDIQGKLRKAFKLSLKLFNLYGSWDESIRQHIHKYDKDFVKKLGGMHSALESAAAELDYETLAYRGLSDEVLSRAWSSLDKLYEKKERRTTTMTRDYFLTPALIAFLIKYIGNPYLGRRKYGKYQYEPYLFPELCKLVHHILEIFNIPLQTLNLERVIENGSPAQDRFQRQIKKILREINKNYKI